MVPMSQLSFKLRQTCRTYLYAIGKALRCRRAYPGVSTLSARAIAQITRFHKDQSGAYAVLVGITLPVLVGSVGLGTEVGLWYHKHRTIQNAADAAAISAALAGGSNEKRTAEAHAIAASFGLVPGAKGVTLTLNRPPSAGKYVSSSAAIEVIIQEPQERLFAALFGSGSVPIRARAVALADVGPGCVLALNRTIEAAGATVGNTSVNLLNCSLYDNSGHSWALKLEGSSRISALSVGVVGGIFGQHQITATDGVMTGIAPVADPYADRSYPRFSGCDHNNFRAPKTGTLSPGVFCNGMRFDGGTDVTLSPGIYYVDRGSFYVAGNATIKGRGVTIVFTSSTGSNWAAATIEGGANVHLTAPTSGPTEGIVFFGDRKMPNSTLFRFAGGANQHFDGSVYLPSGRVEFAGGSNTTSSCTKLIADTISFVGPATLKLDCSGFGDDGRIGTKAMLVE
jgi:hypothetical protein